MGQQQNDMYYPESFFTIDILKEVLSEYQWHCKYELKEGAAGNVLLKFPRCILVISEGFESNMIAYFKKEELGRTEMQGPLTILHAVSVIRSQIQKDPSYQDPFLLDLDIRASLKKVKDGLRNICILIQTFLLPCVIDGDFSWVEEYNKEYPGL